MTDDNFIWQFLLVTIFMGGTMSRIAGRSLAGSWHKVILLPVAALLLAAAIRFLHFALFGSDLFSLRYFLVDYMAALSFAVWGYYSRRAELICTLYPWLFERRGPLMWRARRALS